MSFYLFFTKKESNRFPKTSRNVQGGIMRSPLRWRSKKRIIFSQNKTQVEIRFHLDSATWLSKEVKEIIKNKYSNQITKNGYIIVRSERTRSQLLNQADALQKLRHFIWTAVDEVRTYLERTQIDDVQKEKLIKAQERAARERVRSKRQHGQMRNFKRGIDQN